MNNLITTIIGIALVAILALAGAYYGGNAFQQGQINAIADSVINESQQLLTAERFWAVNNNQPDISGMNSPSTSNGVTYFLTGNVSGAGISMLLDSKLLAEWPPIGGILSGPAPASGITNYSSHDYGCYNFSGYQGRIGRVILAYNGGNYVQYSFGINVPFNGTCQNQVGFFYTSTTDTSQANHPIVLIAKAVNAKLNQTPSNVGTSYMASLGLPTIPSGSTNLWNGFYIDSNGIVQTNYCYLYNSQYIFCNFGPS